LVSDGAIGWDGGLINLVSPHYLSGTDVVVQGRLGQETSLQGSGGTVHVFNNSQIPEPGNIQDEVEGKNADDANGFFIDFTQGALVALNPDGTQTSPFD